MPRHKRKAAGDNEALKEELIDGSEEKMVEVKSVNEEDSTNEGEDTKAESKVEATKTEGVTSKEAEEAEREAATANALEEAALKKEALRRLKESTDAELERQVTFLLNQSAAFTGFMSEKLKDNAVKESEESKENKKPRSRKATLAEKDAVAGAAKASKLESVVEGHTHLPTLFVNGTLRPYQVEGYQWMKTLYLTGINGILADEMGLGKTVQAIAMIAHLYEMGFSTKGPTLVVAPLSTLPNWDAEFKRFAPDIPVILYHGTKESRVGLRKKVTNDTRMNGELHYPVIITSYQMIAMDAGYFAPYTFVYFVMDEGHRIKNHKCQLLRCLKKLNISDGRLLLTGTPLQNDLNELWSLLNFILPNIFSDMEWFSAYFDFSGGKDTVVELEKKKAMVSKLHAILKPILLRRMKVDVELNLPPKREIIVYAPLTAEQEIIYRKVLDNALKAGLPPTEGNVRPESIMGGKRKRAKQDYAAMLEDDDDKYLDSIADKATTFDEMSEEFGDWSSMAPKARVWVEGGIWRNPELDCQSRNALMLLRQIALHPFTVQLPTDASGPYVPEDESVVSSSGKMLIADQLLMALKKGGHKVLLFSQFKGILDILEVYCGLRSFGYVRLDGSTALEDRAERIRAFNTESETFIFLISTRAGNLGMNLCAADSVIIFDSDWNPQSDLQAQDRCHRIGQTRPVVVYRLTTRGTVDEKIVETAISKRRVERTVIGGGKFHKLGKGAPEDGVALEELVRLLDETDHSGTVDAEKGSLLTDEDLKSLIDRTFVQGEADLMKKKGGRTKSQAGKNFKVIPQTSSSESNQ